MRPCPFTLLLSRIPIVLAAWFLIGRTGVQDAPGPPPVKPLAQPLEAAKAGAAHVWAAAPATSAMRTRFETASNYAAFIHDAMSRPAEGGRFYAQLAHIRCMETGSARLDAAVESATHPERQAQALRFAAGLQQRCAGVAAQFPDTATFWRSLKHSNARGTPDELLKISLMATGGTGREDLRRAQELGDPYLLAATLELNAELFADGIDPAYAEGRNREVLFTAAGAAACAIVGDCRDNWRLKFFCAVGGHCEFDDYRDFARAGLDPQQRPLFDTTLKALLKRVGY